MGTRIVINKSDFSNCAIKKIAQPVFNYITGAITSSSGTTVDDNTHYLYIESPSGADIYYTTNGDDPTQQSTKYTGKIIVNGTETVKAICINGVSSNVSVIKLQDTISRIIQDRTNSESMNVTTLIPDGLDANKLYKFKYKTDKPIQLDSVYIKGNNGNEYNIIPDIVKPNTNKSLAEKTSDNGIESLFICKNNTTKFVYNIIPTDLMKDTIKQGIHIDTEIQNVDYEENVLIEKEIKELSRNNVMIYGNPLSEGHVYIVDITVVSGTPTNIILRGSDSNSESIVSTKKESFQILLLPNDEAYEGLWISSYNETIEVKVTLKELISSWLGV